jgi:hypothetical protein
MNAFPAHAAPPPLWPPPQVPKAFSVWSLDSLSPEIVNYVIALNAPPAPTQ